MVHGTHSPMQWLLDLRMYGLKIHYSNTMPGQIGWMGVDTLLYQQLQFSMGDFRGFIHGLVHSTRLQQRFIQTHQGQWNWDTIDQYLRAVAQFQEKLGVLVHVTAGQLARAPELLSIRHWNTENVHRNVFIEDGMVALVTRYHKGFYASNDVKVIH